MNFVLSSLSEGLLWSIVAIGVYLTFRILDIADMTAEGAFPLGAAVVVSQIQAGANPWLATLLALLAGMVAGLVSGMLHTKMKIPALLTGIVTLTGLYSINITPNHSYLSQLDVTYKTPDLMSHFLPPHEVSFTFCCSSIVFPR